MIFFAYNFHIFCSLVKEIFKTLLWCESITFLQLHTIIMSRFSWSFYDSKWSFMSLCVSGRQCVAWAGLNLRTNFQLRLSTIRTLNIMEMDFFFVCINFLLISSHLQFQIFLFQAIKPSLNPPGLRWNTQQETNPNEWMNNRERKNCSFRCFFFSFVSFHSFLFFPSTPCCRVPKKYLWISSTGKPMEERRVVSCLRTFRGLIHFRKNFFGFSHCDQMKNNGAGHSWKLNRHYH